MFSTDIDDIVVFPKFTTGNTTESNLETLRTYRDEINRIKEILTNKHTLSAEAMNVYKKILNDMVRKSQSLCQKIQGNDSPYIEKHNLDDKREVDHLITQRDLLKRYMISEISFETMISCPLVNLSVDSHLQLASAGLAQKNMNPKYPFRRYKNAGLDENVYTRNGTKIDFTDFTIEDHFRLFPVIEL